MSTRMLVDPKVFELAGGFLDDVCCEEPIASRPLSEERYDELNQRLAEAMQIAIEQECEAIREELLDHRDYSDAVDSGTGPVLERDR